MRNLRHALRALARAPGLTATVVVTLALGIGVNSAVFTAIDTILLSPLPFPDGDRLVRLNQVVEGTGETGIAPVRLEDWDRLSSTFDGISGFFTSDLVAPFDDAPERLRHAPVAPRFFEVLGIGPVAGSGFTDEDHEFQAPVVLVISDDLWRRRFGADADVVGRTIGSGQQAATVVGLMPASFEFPDDNVEFWNPIADAPWTQDRALTWYEGIGRLKAGVTLEQARADLESVQAALAEQYPDTDRGIGIQIRPLKETVVGGTRASLWVLFGAVTVLLLIACTNIAALLLARAARREHETAVRYSLGASRAAVAVPMLTESAVLAFTGAALGVLVALGTLAAFRLLAPELPRLDEVAVDARMLAYTAAATVVVALGCGLFPALRSARRVVSPAGARGQVSQRHSLQWLLVGVQVALSVMLLAGAGLLLRSVEALSRVDMGFDASSVLTLRVTGAYGEEGTNQRVQRLNRALDALVSQPGIEAAAISSALPGVPVQEQVEFELLEGRGEAEPPIIAHSRVVTPSYFATMRIPLQSGELCRRPEDAENTAPEAVVNQRFAERYFAERSVIGLHVSGGLDYLAQNNHLPRAPPARVVGIVADARELGADREPAPTVYSCFSAPNPSPWILARTGGDPTSSTGAIRGTINELEPTRAVYDVAPLERRIDEAYAQNRLRTILLALFAATALALACLGVYGTLSYVVSLRRREVGLHMALGAVSGNIVAQYLGKALRVVAVACAAGLALSFLFTRGLSGMLYGVSPTDPLTLSGVVVIVAGVAAAAALLPAVRASRVDPMEALRDE